MIFTLGAVGSATERELSQLKFIAPENWQCASNAESKVISLMAPGGKVSVTLNPSIEFAGTAEQWQQKLWHGILQNLKLVEPAVAGVQGQFLTRMGVFDLPNGTQRRICLYSLVKNGRGEAVIFRASDDRLFLENLFAVNQMIDAITVGNDVQNESTKTASTSHLPMNAFTPTSNRSATRSIATNTTDVVPVLNYDEPANFYRGAGFSPIEYSSTEVNCSMQVYEFRPSPEDIRAKFQQTMLREWIDPRYRESHLAAQPVFSTSSAPGADAVLTAYFHESPVGLPNERLRILIIARNRAAIVDIIAHNAYCWQRANPPLTAMLASLRVGKQAAPPSLAEGPGPAGTTIAGLYRGYKSKYMVNLFRPVGYGDFVMALHYYLFSPDGRVFRCYDFPPGPNGHWQNFDFDTSQRHDPVNTGRYTVRDNQLFIRFNEPSGMITTTLTDRNSLEIETVNYARQ